MSNKQLDESNIVNELKGSSLFFQSDSDAAPQFPASNPTRDTVIGPETAKGDSSGVDLPPTLPNPARAATTSRRGMSPAPSVRNEATPVNPTPTTPDSLDALASNNATNERPVEPPFVRSNERTKIRHTFDILADQLLALREIAVEREKLFGDRVLLGDLVQEALDMLIAKERNQT